MFTKDQLRHALIQLRADLRKKLDDGAKCPLCDQHAQIYRRKINSGMAKSLIAMYRQGIVPGGGTDYMHIPTVIGSRSREEGKLAYWQLIEEEAVHRPDGGRAGYWRLTWRGQCFVEGRIRLPKYAEIYAGKVVGMDSTEMISIHEALTEKFNYADLMAGV